MTATSHPVDAVLDDCAYEEEVLLLLKGSSEAEIDAELASRARALGLQVQAPSTALLHQPGPDEPSARTSVSLTPSRSTSFDSRHSPSASITSSLSWNLNDTPLQNVYASRFPSFSRPSLSEKAENGQQKPPALHRHSAPSSSYILSPPLTDMSYTIEEEVSRKPFSVRRGLNRLSGKPKRTTHQTVGRGRILCQSCPEYAAPPKQIYVLRCQHALCRLHLRELVLQFVNNEDLEAPQCCGQPISRSHIQSVTSENEEGKLFLRMPSASSRTSLTSSITSELRLTSLSTHSRNTSIQSVTTAAKPWVELKPHDFEQILDRAIAASAAEHREQRKMEQGRFVKFYEKELESLADRHNHSKEMHKREFDRNIEEIRESTPTRMASLEDEHVAVEMELLRAQEIEKRTASIALRYKEGYCAGHDPEGTGRVVTQQDRQELEKQRHICDTMEQRHDAAINVLRQQQVRQLRRESETYEKQVSGLERRRDRELKELDQIYEVERKQLEQVTAGRAERLLIRWNLTSTIWKAQREKVADTANLELSGALNYMDLSGGPGGIEQACS